MKSIFKLIHRVSEKIGLAASFLTLVMMGIIAYDVIGRYLLGNPTSWAYLMNKQLFGTFILFAGVYTMAKGGHIRIEMFYDRFPPKIKFISRLISLLLFSFFMVCLIWQSAWMGIESFAVRERAMGLFRMPLYPLKLLITVVSCLFFLEGIALFLLGKNK